MDKLKKIRNRIPFWKMVKASWERFSLEKPVGFGRMGVDGRVFIRNVRWK